MPGEPSSWVCPRLGTGRAGQREQCSCSGRHRVAQISSIPRMPFKRSMPRQARSLGRRWSSHAGPGHCSTGSSGPACCSAPSSTSCSAWPAVALPSRWPAVSLSSSWVGAGGHSLGKRVAVLAPRASQLEFPGKDIRHLPDQVLASISQQLVWSRAWPISWPSWSGQNMPLLSSCPCPLHIHMSAWPVLVPEPLLRPWHACPLH